MDITYTSLLGIAYSYFAPYNDGITRYFRFRRLIVLLLIPLILGILFICHGVIPTRDTCLTYLTMLMIIDTLLMVVLAILHLISGSLKYHLESDYVAKVRFRNTRFRALNYMDIHVAITWILLVHFLAMLACAFFLVAPDEYIVRTTRYSEWLSSSSVTLLAKIGFTIIITSIFATLLSFVDIARRFFNILQHSDPEVE